MKRIMVLHILLCLLVMIIPLTGKRLAPRRVKPVILNYFKYEAVPFPGTGGQNGGYVRVRSMKTGRIIRGRFIYRIQYRKGLEKDIQDVHITSMKRLSGRKIEIRNRRGDIYHLHTDTWRVYHVIR